MENICVYLGLADDAETCALFPTYCNHCYKATPNEMVALDHQRKYCLTEAYTTCPVFTQSSNNQLPNDIRAKSNRLVHSIRLVRSKVLLVAILLSILALIFLLFFSRRPLIPVSGSRIAEEEIISSPGNSGQTMDKVVVPAKDSAMQNSTETHTPLVLLAPTLTTSKGSLTAPALSVNQVLRLRGLDMPISRTETFIIRQVNNEESLSQYVSTYLTSAESILPEKCNIPVSLWENPYLVNPHSSNTSADLSCFEMYQVNPTAISADEFVDELTTDYNRLIFYKEIKPGESLENGEWLIIPTITPVQ